MEVLMIVIAGIIVSVGIYLLLTRSILRVILGTILLSHAAHLMLLTMGGLDAKAPPLLGEEAVGYTDPLPQALILTAIVISFGVTAFLLVLAYRTYKVHKTDDLEQLKGGTDE